MAFKVFASGDVLTAADVNDYLMEQSVIQCTSSTRPSSPNDGMLIYETDTEQFLFYEDSGWRVLVSRNWTAYTPTWSNYTPGADGVVDARYAAVGKSVTYVGSSTVGVNTSIGSGAVDVAVSLPFAPASGAYWYPVGSWWAYDASTGKEYVGSCRIGAGTSLLTFVHSDSASNSGKMNDTNPFVWASTDIFAWAITYEAA